MSETEVLSALIGDIYDAALDPALWPDVLGKIYQFVGGCGAGLYSKDSISRTGNLNYQAGNDPLATQMYFDKYVKLDPTTTGFFFFGIEEVVSVVDIMPYDEFLETRFYKEWVRPQGWVDVANSVLEKSTTSYACFSVFRHERDGLTDEPARHRMRLLAPHVRRALLIGKVIDLHKTEAAALADTLDGLAAGMFLVDADGRIGMANVSGHAMLAEALAVRASGGRLVMNDASADQALRDACAAAQGGDVGLGTRGIAVPLLAGNEQRYVAHVLPLTSGARRRAGINYAATAAVFVRKASLEAPSAPETIAKLYRLTPSELRVLLGVFEASGVQDVANALGISETTVKTHLRRLFEKTGTKRQADLVKLVAAHTSPIADSAT